MTNKLCDIPGWAPALHEARERFGHAYDVQTFWAAGALSFPELPKEASLLVVKAALDLVDRLKRCATGLQPKLRRFEMRRRPGGTNVIRVRVGIDATGMAYASELSQPELIEERREAMTAALYWLTHRPIANDNDPEPGRRFRHPGCWPSPRRLEPAVNMSPGLTTRMRLSTRGVERP
jgi:hypothetical protein